MNIKGKVKQVMDTVVVSEKFSKRDLIITDDSNEKYPQHIAIQFTQDRVSVLDGLAPGDEIDVSINIRGREWTSPKDGTVKFFNTIEGWRIENVSTETGGGESFHKIAENSIVVEKDDSLPF
jgi:hypothetical protein